MKIFQKPLYSLLVCASCMTLVACDSGQADNHADEKTTASADSNSSDSPFSVAGIDDVQAVADFLASLKKSVAEDDRDAVVSMIYYPFTTYDGGDLVKQYPDKASVLADYDLLFNDQVKTEIAKATVDSLFATIEGIMIGQGQIWFNLFDGELKIMTVQSIN